LLARSIGAIEPRLAGNKLYFDKVGGPPLEDRTEAVTGADGETINSNFNRGT
jgi:hypothetical protein